MGKRDPDPGRVIAAEPSGGFTDPRFLALRATEVGGAFADVAERGHHPIVGGGFGGVGGVGTVMPRVDLFALGLDYAMYDNVCGAITTPTSWRRGTTSAAISLRRRPS